MNLESKIACPICHKVIVVLVEIESSSDYYYDSLCPECMKIFDSMIYEKLYNDVVDEYIGRAEFANDCSQDR